MARPHQSILGQELVSRLGELLNRVRVEFTHRQDDIPSAESKKSMEVTKFSCPQSGHCVLVAGRLHPGWSQVGVARRFGARRFGAIFARADWV